MRKSLVTMGLVLAISATSTFTAFADWEQTGATWKYNSNGTYFNNGWHWIDGNGDNIAECYYFNADGIMLASTITPDNFTVNENGAWIVNGVVQTQSNKSANPSGGIDTSGWDTGGSTVETPKLSDDQRLSPEEYQELNEIQFNSAPTYEPGSTVTDANGVTVEIGNISNNQSLPSEINDAINEIHFY